MNKIISFLVFMSVFVVSFGQQTNEIQVTLDHFALSVSDVDQAVQFYKDILHLKEITNRTESEGIRWMSLGDEKELHLVSTVHSEIQLNKAVHLALATTDFDGIVKNLQDKGINYSNWPGEPNKISIRADGIRQVYFQDPDGYWIEVNSVKQNTD